MGRINIIRTEGGSRVVSVSRAIPKEWKAVEVEVIKATDDVITVKFNKVK